MKSGTLSHFIGFFCAVPPENVHTCSRAFLCNLPMLFLGRRFYKSLWVYADALPVSRNPSGLSSADHGYFKGFLQTTLPRWSGEKEV